MTLKYISNRKKKKKQNFKFYLGSFLFVYFGLHEKTMSTSEVKFP